MEEEVLQSVRAVRLIVFYLILSLGLWQMDRVGWLDMPRGLGERGLAKVFQMTDKGVDWLAAPVRWVIQMADAGKRTRVLEQKLAATVVDRARMAALEEENQVLRQVKGIADNKQVGPTVMAGLMREVNGVVGLDKGFADGIVEGMMVVDDQGVLLGRVTEVSISRSRMLPLYHAGSRIPVRVMGAKTVGILEGDGAGARLSEVLQADPLAVGDILVTTNDNGIFPEGVVVGEVSILSGAVADVTKGAAVMLLGNTNRIVFIR